MAEYNTCRHCYGQIKQISIAGVLKWYHTETTAYACRNLARTAAEPLLTK